MSEEVEISCACGAKMRRQSNSSASIAQAIAEFLEAHKGHAVPHLRPIEHRSDGYHIGNRKLHLV